MARAVVQKFVHRDKALVTGFVGHTRTGACTAKGKCYHSKRRVRARGKK